MEALDRDVKKQNENPSIGVLLCKDKGSEVVEYALSRSLSPTMVSEYKTQLPDKKLLQKKYTNYLTIIGKNKNHSRQHCLANTGVSAVSQALLLCLAFLPVDRKLP